VKTLIVEDELNTARTLQRLLREVRPQAEVLCHTESVADTVQWLQENPAPDLILMDIHLGDGSSFEVFRRVQVSCPVIFITAYDEHALEAFRVNSIDYLLKPLTRADLQRSLDKFDALRQHYAGNAAAAAGSLAATPPTATPDFTELLRTMQQQLAQPNPAKASWLIPHKTKLIPVAAEEVAHFVIRHGLVSLTTLSGQEYTVDFTLDELESQVDGRQFFRANRQVLFARASLVELEPYYNGRMVVHLKPAPREEVIVPKPRVTELKQWISRH
jgi:DNA-binding LytR/AlgR family response regulator